VISFTFYEQTNDKLLSLVIFLFEVFCFVAILYANISTQCSL